MRYDFSAHFLRVIPPDTTFGDAWESLCDILLRKELGTTNVIRLRPPDRGIDILYRAENKAFQCKSTERGICGVIDAEESAKSLETANKHRHTIEWMKYCFATNAEYTGAGYEKIVMRAREIGVDAQHLEFLGPAYWDDLCTTYSDVIKDRFDYRVNVNEKHLLEALQSSISGSRSTNSSPEVEKTEESIIVTNNLTQLELKLPLQNDLTVGSHIELIIKLLRLSDRMDIDGYLGTTSRPLFSLRFRGKELSIFARIKDLDIQPGDKLELHAKLDLEALAAFDGIIKRFPNNVAAQIGKAEILLSLGRFDEALSSYESIIVRHPENVIAKSGRAIVLKVMGRYSESLHTYNEIIAKHPDIVVARIGKAEVLKSMGRVDEALAVYGRSAQDSDYAVSREDNAEISNHLLPKAYRFDQAHVSSSIEKVLQAKMWEAAKRLLFKGSNTNDISRNIDYRVRLAA